MIRVTEENSLRNYNRVLKDFEPTFAFHKSVIVEEILKETNPLSIYLAGSFGRNEGSFYLSKNGFVPLRDYDILVVLEKLVTSETIARIRTNIHRKLGLSDPFQKRWKFEEFSVWITQTTLKDIDVLPMLKVYELKETSKLLWGKDIRSNVRMDFSEVSPYNGVLILLSKVEGLLGLLDIRDLRENVHAPAKADLVYECLKSYVEIGTSLSILLRSYESSFVGRCARVSKSFDVQFPSLYRMNNALPSLMITCSYRRLLMDDDFLASVDTGKLLSATVRDLKITLWYYLNRAYGANGFSTPTYAEVFDHVLTKLNTRVLIDLFDYFMQRKFRIHSRKATEIVTRVYVRFVLLRFFVQARKKGYRIKPRLLLARNSNIMLRLWMTAFMLLESVKEDLSLDDDSLSAAAEKLGEILDADCMTGHSGSRTQSRFRCFQKMAVDLLDLGDKIFHRKD